MSKAEYNAIITKVYRNQDLTMDELKALAENPIEKVLKIEMVFDECFKYRVYWENASDKPIGKII